MESFFDNIIEGINTGFMSALPIIEAMDKDRLRAKIATKIFLQILKELGACYIGNRVDLAKSPAKQSVQMADLLLKELYANKERDINEDKSLDAKSKNRKSGQ